MKWPVIGLFCVLAVTPATSKAQRVLAIGAIPQIADTSPTTWAISGYEIIRLRSASGGMTPIMRSEAMDARTVEILSRTQAPPLRASDIQIVNGGGAPTLVVRGYLLCEVMPQDAKAAGMSQAALARVWLASVKRVLPQIAPLPSRFGV